MKKLLSARFQILSHKQKMIIYIATN